MLRSSRRWKPKKKVLALYCVWALILPNCGTRRGSTSTIPQQVVSSSAHRPKSKNAYRSIKPKDLSQHLRAVYQISEQNYQSAALAASGQGQPAVEDADTARLVALLAEKPDDPVLTRSLADRYFSQGRVLDALELYSRLEKKDPQDRQVQRSLALVWDAWSNYPKALEHASRALQPSEMTAADWLFLGRIHLRGANLGAAIPALRKAVEMEPADSTALAQLGDAFFRRQDWEEAASFLKRAVQLDQRLTDARRQLALSLAHLRLDEEAAQEFMALQPAAQAYNQLGLVQITDRRWEAANRSFAAALTADPSFEEARENLARTEIYRPLAASITLPSFDLPAVPVWRVELGPAETPFEPAQGPPPRQDSTGTAGNPFVVEVEGGPIDVTGLPEPAPHQPLPSPIRVVDHVGQIQAIVQLPEFPTSTTSDNTTRPIWLQPEGNVEPRLDSAARKESEVAQASLPLSVAWEPTVIDLASARPLDEVRLVDGRPAWPLPANELVTSDPGWTVPTLVAITAPEPGAEPTLGVPELSPTLWSRLEGTQPSIRFSVGRGTGLPAMDRGSDRLRPSAPGWELRPVRPSAATPVVDRSEDWTSVSTAILEGLGKMVRLTWPESLEIAPAANQLPAFRPITVGELSVVLGPSPPSQPVALTAPQPNSEGMLQLMATTGNAPRLETQWVAPQHLTLIGLPNRPAPKYSVGSSRHLRAAHTTPADALNGSSGHPRSARPRSEIQASVSVDRPTPKSGATEAISGRDGSGWSQRSFPQRFARMPTRHDGEPRFESAEQPLAKQASKWKLTFLVTIGAGLLGTALAYFLGFGAVATLLIGILAGFGGGALTLSHSGAGPAQARFLPARNRESA